MSFLERIVTARRRAVEELKRDAPISSGAPANAPTPRAFRAALLADGMSIIGEIKRRSPSKGDLNPDLDPVALARAYERGGARCLSVLTEPEFFSGSIGDLSLARSATTLPTLYKDFVLDPVQVLDARRAGADAVLLIVRMLSDPRADPRADLLADLVAEVKRWGMCPLVEIFDEADLERALEAGADVVGVNHRDLETFEEDPSATKRLRPLVPDDVVLVAESAISTRADIEALEDIGVRAALVGEAFVTAADPEAKVRELLGSS
jgi:indole-3-glycerol phosphate synthase